VAVAAHIRTIEAYGYIHADMVPLGVRAHPGQSRTSGL
jgi:hypothetical protein